MAEIKRLHYFREQFLLESDFTAEQAYHMRMRRHHNQLCHGFGVVSGLVVTRTGDRQVQIGAGTAVDGEGREIVLVAPVAHDLRREDSDIYLTISYLEEHDPSDRVTHGSATNYIRWTERPRLQENSELPLDRSQVVLARITLTDTNAIDVIDTSVAPKAAVSSVAPGAIHEEQLADRSVTTGKLAPQSVASENLASGAVTSQKLALESVTNEHLALGAVGALELAPGSVGIGALAITASEEIPGTLAARPAESNFTLTVDSPSPQFLLFSVTPTTLNGELSITQSVKRGGSASNNQVTFTVTVKNLGTSQVHFTVSMKTLALA